MTEQATLKPEDKEKNKPSQKGKVFVVREYIPETQDYKYHFAVAVDDEGKSVCFVNKTFDDPNEKFETRKLQIIPGATAFEQNTVVSEASANLPTLRPRSIYFGAERYMRRDPQASQSYSPSLRNHVLDLFANQLGVPPRYNTVPQSPKPQQ